MEASPEDDKSTPVNEENTQENLPEVDESSSEGKGEVLNPCLRVSLKNVVLFNGTFDDNFGFKNTFTK